MNRVTAGLRFFWVKITTSQGGGGGKSTGNIFSVDRLPAARRTVFVVVRQRCRHARQKKIKRPVAQAGEPVYGGRHDLGADIDTRVHFRKPLDELRKNRGGDRLGISDLQLARSRIGQEFDVPDPLAQFIECSACAHEQGARVDRRLDAA